MKALAVVIAVLIALWVVGRVGARSAGALGQGGTAHVVEVASMDSGEASISAEAATQEHR